MRLYDRLEYTALSRRRMLLKLPRVNGRLIDTKLLSELRKRETVPATVCSYPVAGRRGLRMWIVPQEVNDAGPVLDRRLPTIDPPM
jgi:cell division FtsZ-interacting protein ZapD